MLRFDARSFARNFFFNCTFAMRSFLLLQHPPPGKLRLPSHSQLHLATLFSEADVICSFSCLLQHLHCCTVFLYCQRIWCSSITIVMLRASNSLRYFVIMLPLIFFPSTTPSTPPHRHLLIILWFLKHRLSCYELLQAVATFLWRSFSSVCSPVLIFSQCLTSNSLRATICNILLFVLSSGS